MRSSWTAQGRFLRDLRDYAIFETPPWQRTPSPCQLYISPATLLELQFLIEVGRIRLREGTLDRLAEDDRWLLDDPPAAAWFGQAIDLPWTRDPFDRLLVAHARLRGWRFATADTALLKRLEPRERLEI